MHSKKIFIIFVSISLILSTMLFFFRKDLVMAHVENQDVYKVYDEITSTTASKYETLSSSPDEKYLFIYNPAEKSSQSIKDNLSVMLSQIKKNTNYKACTDSDFSFNEYDSVIIDCEDLDEFKYFDQLFEYVKSGGSVIFAQRPLNSDIFQSLTRNLGIHERGPASIVKGLKLLTNLMAKSTDLTNSTASISSIQVQLDDDCIIHAVSNDDRPIIWEKPLDKGKILFTNSDFFSDKNYRGLFVGLLSKTKSNFIYPVMNMKLNFIDNYPSPLPLGNSDTLYSQYGLSTSEFYSNIWWPAMLKTSRQYDAKYSANYIETYDDWGSEDSTKEESEANSKTLLKLGYEFIKNEGELGLHGYNNLPLVSIDARDTITNPDWTSENNMIEALTKVKNFSNSLFPNYKLRNYVPPLNIIDETGLSALQTALPDLKVISSVYKSSGKEYEQDFSKSATGLLNIPRISSGYLYSDEEKWNIYNGIMAYGTFSHVVNPDDISDPERNSGMTWDDLDKDYSKMMSDINTDFTWLHSMTISNGGVELERYLDNSTEFKYNGNSISGFCKDFKESMSYILRTDSPIQKSENCYYTEIDDNIYIVTATSCEFKIETDGVK